MHGPRWWCKRQLFSERARFESRFYISDSFAAINTILAGRKAFPLPEKMNQEDSFLRIISFPMLKLFPPS